MNRKYIVGIFLVVLLLSLVIFYSAASYMKKSEQAAIMVPTPTPTTEEPSIDKAQPDIVAASFYSAYQNCMRLSGSPNSTETLSQFCQTNNRLTLGSFNEQIKSQAPNSTGIDPVFCAKEPPTDLNNDLKLGTTSFLANGTANVPIIETYGEKTITIQFTMQKNNLDQWKVAKITCQ